MSKVAQNVAGSQERLTSHNLWSFSLGGVGRDLMYQLFNTYMLTCILLTKGVNTAEFAIVGVVIMCCRIFDALNDPIMGSIIEITRTKWGKFKPWIMIGAISNSIVVFLMFWVPLKGMSFVIFFAIMYIVWSITFTMNDISYWSMLPSLTSHHEDRDKLSSIANICAGIGAGLATIIVPTLTTGSMTIGGSATTAFPVLAIVIGIIFIGCQLMTCICVKEKPLPPLDPNRPKVNPLKQIFKVLKGNDQLRWTAIIMFIHNLGSSILGGLSTWYVYFRFGYEGAMVSLFGILTGIAGAILVIYPLLAKKFNRRQISKICLILIYIGYGAMLAIGLATQNVQSDWVFYPIALSGAFWAIGQAVFYQVQTITIANSVEYNEWKTGNREEGIIFSIRPLAAKMGSAAQMGVVTIILSILGIADITDKISEQENLVNMGQITAEAKLTNIEAIIAQVPQSTVNWLLVCMTVLPMIIMTITVVLYLKKSILDEEMYERMRSDIEARKGAQEEESTQKIVKLTKVKF